MVLSKNTRRKEYEQMKRRLTALLLVLTLLATFTVPVIAGDYWWEEYVETPLEDWSISDDGQVESTGKYVLFTSDAHRYTYLVKDLLAAANGIIAEDGEEGNVGLFAYGGDFANEYVLYDDNMSIMKMAIASSEGTVATYTKGNHEGSVSDEDFEAGTGMSRIGETAVNVDGNYHFFNFGALDKNQKFTEEDIATLTAYLESIEDDKPIFIVSHYPLHYYNDRRSSKLAAEMAELLNGYPQVTFLWGHNHTEQDPNYGMIRLPGDIIQTGATADTSVEINFTYACLGACRDGVNGANGLLAKVDGSTITFRYINLNNDTSDDVWIDAQGNENPVRIPGTPEVSSTTVVDTAADLHTITLANIQIDRPLVDKAPAEAPYEYSDRFDASAIEWSGALNNGLYDFSTEYTATLTLTAGEGYAFAPDAVVSVNKEYVGPMPGQKNNEAAATVSEDGKTVTVVYSFPATVNAGEQPIEAATALVEGGVYVVAAVDSNMAASYMYDPTQHGEESMPDYTAASADVVIREDKLISEVTADTMFTAQKDDYGYLLWSDESLKAGEGATTLNFLSMSTRGGELGLEAAESAGNVIYNNWALTEDGVPYLNVDGAVKYLNYAGGLFGYVDAAAESNVRLYQVGTADGTVYNASVSVAAPVPGEAASTEAVTAAGTVESVVWDAETFDYGTAYTVTVTIAPAGQIGSALTARVNGNAAEAEAVEGKLVVSYTFPETAAEPGAKTALVATEADAIVSGSHYVIVANGKAMTSATAEGMYLSAVDVTVEDGKITSDVTADMIFCLTGNTEDGFSVKNGGLYMAGLTDGSPDIWGIASTEDATSAVTYNYVDGKLEVVSTGVVAGPGPASTTVSYLYEYDGHFNFSAYNSSDITLYKLEMPFTDVPENWAHKYIYSATLQGLMKGTDTTLFEPEETMTRAMAIEVLYRLEGSPAVSGELTFSDVEPQQYYANAVIWGTQNDIIKGTEVGIFSPNVEVTREMFAAMISRYLNMKGIVPDGEEIIFADIDDAEDYAKEHIDFCAKAGIIVGYPDGTFKPKANIERQEAATMLVRLSDLID